MKYLFKQVSHFAQTIASLNHGLQPEGMQAEQTAYNEAVKVLETIIFSFQGVLKIPSYYYSPTQNAYVDCLDCFIMILQDQQQMASLP